MNLFTWVFPKTIKYFNLEESEGLTDCWRLKNEYFNKIVKVLPYVKDLISLKNIKISKKMLQSILCCGIKWDSLRFNSCDIDTENLYLPDTANCQVDKLQFSFLEDGDQYHFENIDIKPGNILFKNNNQYEILYDLLPVLANSNLKETVNEVLLSIHYKNIKKIKRILDEEKLQKLVEYRVIQHKGSDQGIRILFIK